MIHTTLDRATQVIRKRTACRCGSIAAATVASALLFLAASSWLPTVATVAVLGAVAVLAVLHPPSALLLVPLTIPFAPLSISIGPARFSVLEIAVSAGVLGMVTREVISLTIRRRWRPLAAETVRIVGSASFASLAIGLIAVGTASLGVVAAPDHLQESFREWRWVILEPVVWYAVALWGFRGIDARWRLVVAWVGASVVASVVSLAEWLAGGGLAVEGVRRLVGFYSHPNAAALSLERAAIVAAALALVKSGRVRLCWALAATAIGVATLLTFSRGAWMALVVASIVAAAFLGHRRFGFVVAALAGIAILTSLLLFPQRFRPDLTSGSEGLRLAIWRSTAHMLADRPLTGVGLDQYLYQYAPRYVEPLAWPERFTSHPHNLFLDAWVRLGVPGLVLVGCACWLVIGRIRRDGDPIAMAMGLGLLAGGLHGLVDRGYFTLELALSFWLTAVILDLPRTVPGAASEGGR